MMGNGDGSFTPTFDLFRFGKPSPPQFGLDLNGDGVSDLLELDSWTSSFNQLLDFITLFLVVAVNAKPPVWVSASPAVFVFAVFSPSLSLQCVA